MTTEGRPDIPDGIKREVRQRCGFGCVLCGFPIYEYEHIIDYSIVREHVAANLTLLCPNHHAQKTRKLISRQVVETANANPLIGRAVTPRRSTSTTKDKIQP
jgi:5-methylcytosine-specific restriction endonuclease McrA